MRSLAFAALLACSLAPVAAGCASPDDVSDTGVIELSVIHPNPDGSWYFLADAAFEVTSIAGTETVYWNDADPLQLALPPGLASVRLLDGWRLEKYERGSNVPQVQPAALGTINPVELRILAGVTASIDFGFIVRTGTGSIRVDFGVLTDPRELAGGIRVESATGILAPYVENAAASRLDFAFYFGLGRLESVVLPDGTKDHVYTAGSYQYRETPLVADFYNDQIGILANEVAPALAAGLLEYHLAARPDGTIELSGGLWSWLGDVTLEIAPHTLNGTLPLGPDGFPADAFFHDGSVPFTLTVSLPSGDGSLSGFLNLRHITDGTAP